MLLHAADICSMVPTSHVGCCMRLTSHVIACDIMLAHPCLCLTAQFVHGPGFAVSIRNGTPGELLETLPRGWTRHPCALWGEPAVKARRKRPRWHTVLVGG